jgi:hypothetical protein
LDTPIFGGAAIDIKGAFEGGVRRKVMLSYLLFVVSVVSNPGFNDSGFAKETMSDGGGRGETGGLVVKMGPVMNMHVEDVRVISGRELPAIAPKGSLFESFSKSRLYAVRYDK